jgi:hypothetical protein
MKPNPHPVQASVRKKFFDNFIRNNTDNDLGIVSDGSRWDSVRGVFRVLFNRAVSETPPSEYPLATVTMPFEEVQISLKEIDSGVGAALWVADSGNWWAIGLDQEQVDCNCSQGTQCNRWNSRNCSSWNAQECFSWFCSTWNARTQTNACAVWNARTQVDPFDNATCLRWSLGNCRRWAGRRGQTFCAERNASTCNAFMWNSSTCRTRVWNSSTCAGNACGAANASNCRTWNSQTCNRWFEFTFDCETCYPQYVRIIQSVGATVSTIFSAIVTKTFQVVSSTYGSLSLFVQSDTSSPSAKSMRVSTENGSIEAEVFSDTQLNNKIIVDEEIIYSPTGAQVLPTYGIIISPSSYNQTNYIGEINIDKI